MTKTVFISLPMSGYDEETILQNIEAAKKEYCKRRNVTENQVSFVTNINAPTPSQFVTEGFEGVWYLGYALVNLSKCSEAFFFGNWKDARGCLIEHEVCTKYNISYMEV